MIEINLLPGAGKKKAAKGGGTKMDFAAAFSGLSAKVKDKFLAAAVVCVVIGIGGVATLYALQEKRADELSQRLNKAEQDSAHYSAAMTDKIRSEAKRDTLLRQLNIIKTIDDDRYIWPHILDEVSRALPAYTWLTDLSFAGTPQGASSVVAAPKAEAPPPAADSTKKTTKKKEKRLATDVPQDSVRIRLQGRTVDIQALTRFMKDLESSPFLGNVTLERSELVIDGGQQVTMFSVTMSYTRPDTSLVRRVALGAPAR